VSIFRRSRRTPEPAPELAVDVDGDDIKFIERLFRHLQQQRETARWQPATPSAYMDDVRERLIRDLYERAGAATAAGSASVPLTEWEISLVVGMRDDLRRCNNRYPRRDPVLDEADRFVARLHMQVGRAKAVRYLGGVAVFHAEQVRADRQELPGGGA
jgi:hypothetical protein